MSVTSSEEIARLIEGTYRGVFESLHPAMRNMVTMGRAYEKALNVASHAAKSYMESIVELGEIASETKASRQYGEVLLQIAATLRDIETQREIVVHSFLKELLVPVEASVDQLQKDLLNKQKNYLQENKIKAEALEKARNDYKKYQKKSQKNTAKYTEKQRRCEQDFVLKEQALDEFRVDALKMIWQEERQRYCFLILQQCGVLKHNSIFHGKALSLYHHRIPEWQRNSEHPDHLPGDCENTLHAFKCSFTNAKAVDDLTHGGRTQPKQNYRRNLSTYAADMNEEETFPNYGRENTPEPLIVDINRHQVMYPSATLPIPKTQSAMEPVRSFSQQQFAKSGTMNSSQGKGTHIQNKSDGGVPALDSGKRVKAVYNHTSTGQNQLSFNEGELIFVIGQHNNGWQFGQNLTSLKSGWFPIAYTEPFQEVQTENKNDNSTEPPLMRHKKEEGLLDFSPGLPMPDYCVTKGAFDQTESDKCTGLLTTATPVPPLSE
ncbi:BAR/IMD domain-containing adapter protein 2-like isoform X2 [Ptychodera flava]|uniref:BAR/IMD domain-containing adapter protein 2-like isoform X2 n=1 Tax=Ptychodera flava TaxID=63121 RepID=UPI00396A00EA